MNRTSSIASLSVLALLAGASGVFGCSSDSTTETGAVAGANSSAGAPGAAGGSHVAGSGNAGAPSGAGGASSAGAANGGSGNAGTASGGTNSAGDGAGGTSSAGTSSGGASAGSGSSGAPAGGSPGAAGSGGTGGVTLTSIGQFALTWYTFQDNTPVNSSISSSGRVLHAFTSVAVPFTQLKAFGGKLDYGDKLFIEFLKDRVMPNGMKHTGWVQIDDYCGDNSDDTYCYQEVGGKKYPNTDLYIGDFTKSGMKLADGDCTGPGGTGQDVTNVSTGVPGALFVTNYGGADLGSGKCDDKATARKQQLGPANGGTSECWGYDEQETGGCGECKIGVSCTSK